MTLSLLSSPATAQDTPVTSLVSAERAFAKASTERGIKAAFLDNLADDAIVFRPGPVAGRAAYEAARATATYLNWEPMLAEVAASGDFGYTTGPYEVRPKGATDSASAWGHYVTMWRRRDAGPWRVALDFGISHAKSPAEQLITRPAGRPAGGDGSWPSLQRADSTLGVAGSTLRAALASRLAADARLYRDGGLPQVGAAAARAALDADARPYHAQPIDGAVAASGDLGYTYGKYELAPAGRLAAEAGFYLRIWRRNGEGRWQVVLDLASATP